MKYFSLYKSPLFLKILFIISVSIIFFIGGITFKHIFVLKKSSVWVTNSYEVNAELERLISYIKDAETGQRGYIISNDKSFLVPYYDSKKSIKVSLQKINRITKNSKIQQENLKIVQFYINKKQNNLFKAINLIENDEGNREQLFENLLDGKVYMDSIRLKVQKMIELEKNLLDHRSKEYEDTMNYTPLFIYLTLLITLLLITISFLKMNTDLNILKKANNELLVSNEANNLAEIVGEFGSWQLNLTKNEFYFSDNQYRLLGCEPKSFDASLEEFLKYVHPEDLDNVVDKTRTIYSDNYLPAFTFRIIKVGGDVRYFRVLGRVVENMYLEKTMIGTTSDVTEEVSANKCIEDRNRELESNNKELNDFNYFASHDLQEPLRIIETFISRLIDKDYKSLTETGQRYITRIQSSTNRMRILIDDLLQFSRTNMFEKVFEDSDLNELLENAKQDLAELIEEKSVVIESDVLPTLHVIPFQIQQLFLNIIGNSIKYSHKDRTPLITISSSQVIAQDEVLLPKTIDKYFKITFTDNGIGFEPKYDKKIFILFNRLHNKNEYDGTGIGLAICKKIVENHKGYLFAEGTPNVGSTFIVYFPVT